MKVDYAPARANPSPNFWTGREGHAITHMVLHGTAGLMPGCLDWLMNPISAASVHYLVDRTGTTHQLVAERDSAWANGVVERGSIFPPVPNPNLFTLSIESERDADNAEPLPPAQVAALIALVADLRRRHGPLPLVPHSAIAPLSRAHCPGERYPLAEIDAGSAQTSTGAVTWTRFTGTPQRLPAVFYADASFARLLYTSRATKKTKLTFDGWKRGVPVRDAATGQDDDRWFHRHNPGGQEGWIPSAWVDGNPKGT